MTGGRPLLRNGRTPTSMLPYIVQPRNLAADLLITYWFVVTAAGHRIIYSCNGERTPSLPPPPQLGAAGQDSPQDTETQTSTFL
jgi:hypothetical protein